MAKKIIYNLNILSFFLLGLFPLVKLNISTFFLIVFIVSSVLLKAHLFIDSVNKKSIKLFFILTSFYLVLIASLLYSNNIEEGIMRISKLIPLIIMPLVLIFFNPRFKNKIIKTFLSVFLISNLIYGIVLLNYLVQGVKTIPNLEGLTFNVFNSNFVFYKINFSDAFWYSNLNIKTSFFFHKAYFSMNFLSCLVVLFLRISKENIKSKLFYIYSILFLFFLFFLIYALSIPNLFAFLLIIILIFVIKLRKVKYKRKLIFSFFFIVPFALGLFFVSTKKSNNIDLNRGVNFIKSVLYNKTIENNDPRYEVYKSVFNIIKKHPIFGVGVGDTKDVLLDVYKLRMTSQKNILEFNEEFNSNSWFKLNVKVFKNVAYGLKKIKNADKIESIKINSANNISQNIRLQPNEYYTLSVFVKPISLKYFILRLGDINTQRANFNLKEGKVEYVGSQLKSANIIKLSNGWFRCYITTPIKKNNKTLVLLGLSGSGQNYISSLRYESALIWGAQLEKGIVLSQYQNDSNELLHYASINKLNTHNNFFYFYVSGGLFCLLLFFVNLFKLFYRAVNTKSILLISMWLIIVINMISENILLRQFGIIYYVIFLILIFQKKSLSSLNNI